MNYGTILIFQYLIVIPTAIYAFFYMPRRGTLATPFENLRRNSQIIGLLPCGVLSIIIALLGAGIYYMVIQSAIKKEDALEERMARPATTTPGANPFGSSSPRPTTNFSSGNPFGGDAGPSTQGGRAPNEPNPFS